jgi:hypothetical protein
MTIVGFIFNTLEAKRADAFNARVPIQNNVNISDIQTAGFNIGSSKEQGLKISFDYSSIYGQEANACIKLAGHLLYMASSEDAKKVVDEWQKTKRLPKILTAGIVEHILQKCTIQALVVSKEMSLPAPISLPKVASSAQQAPAKKAPAPALPKKK